MRRRRFLALAGAGAVAGAAGLVGMQPRRRRWLDAGGARPLRPGTLRRVVVVGGGLAGITAALDLAERGFAVTLIERAPHLGGKLAGWPVEALGETFPAEHGFHGFFSQYYTLYDVLAAAGADQALVPVDGYPVLRAGRAPERFGGSRAPFPLNLASVVARSPAIRLLDFAGDDGAIELLRYDPVRTFARFDDVDFATFCREHVNRPLVETVLEPFGKTTLNRLDRLSTAEAIRFFHFYLLGNPEGLAFRVLSRDAAAAVVEPLGRRLAALGVDVRLGSPVLRLLREGHGVRAVVLGDAAAARPSLRIPADTVPERGWLRVGDDEAPAFVGRHDGAVVALDGRCTHQGCAVRPDPGSGGFRCPCHAGTFDVAGRPSGGPPPRPLDRLGVTAEGADIVLSATGRNGGSPIPCDHCILACDVRGLRRLVAASVLGAPALERAVAALGTADPYVVLRLWLDRPVRSHRAPFHTVAGYGLLDSVAVYSRFQEPFVAWAARTGGSVVELHAYAIPPEALAAPDVLRDRLRGELSAVLPELAAARILHETYMQQDDFTRWAPGDHGLRPRTTTEVPNLFLAGDHVRIDAPVALMEAAAMSGRLAANGILRAEGLQERAIETVAWRGPLAFG